MASMPEPTNMRSYYEATAAARPDPVCLDGDRKCDLCIIGGGVTGLSAALHAATAGLEVVVLEAQRIGWAASGRAGGWLVPAVGYNPAPIAKQLGVEKAKHYFSLAHDAQAFCLALIAQHAIQCDLKRGGAYLAGSDAALREVTNNFNLYAREYGLRNAQMIDASAARDLFGSDRYCGALLDHGLPLIHPLNYTVGIGRAALSAGATIFEGTPVVGYTDDGTAVTVRTKAGATVSARKLLIATNAYLADMEPQLSKRLVTLFGNQIVTAPLPAEVRDSIFGRRDYAGFEASMTPDYFRLTGDGRLLYSSESFTTGRDGLKALPIIRNRLHELFPQTRAVEVEFIFGGWFAVTLSGDVPDIGMLSDNIHFAQAIPIAWGSYHGRMLADYLVGHSSPDYVFMRDLDRPVAWGGRMISRTLGLASELLAGVNRLRR